LVAGVVFDVLDYDLAAPDRQDADVLSYAAGHKVMGLYAMWALRDEIACLAAPELLPKEDRHRLRLEDLLGFRRNPMSAMPLFTAFHARALDGHPTPATPFVRLASGALGVGLASSIGLAIAARDRYGPNCPCIHIVEGEGGLTPGRASEALAAIRPSPAAVKLLCSLFTRMGGVHSTGATSPTVARSALTKPSRSLMPRSTPVFQETNALPNPTSRPFPLRPRQEPKASPNGSSDGSMARVGKRTSSCLDQNPGHSHE
jgi:hypothetical protein